MKLLVFTLVLACLQTTSQQALCDDAPPFVIEDRTFDYTSDWVDIARPLITEASASVSVTAGDALAASSERLRIVVEVEHGPAVILCDVAPGSSWDSVSPSLRSGLGALAQSSVNATRGRFVVVASSASGATRIEVSGLQFEETGRLPEEPLRRPSLVSFEFLASMFDPTSGEPEYSREFSDLGSQDFVDIHVRYSALINPIDPASLGDDDLCFEGEELLGFEPNISFMEATPAGEGRTLAAYRLQRPSEGWGALERQGTVELSVCLGGVRSDSGNRQTVQIGTLTFGRPSWEDIMPAVYDRSAPQSERRSGPYDLERDQEHIDIEFHVVASRIPRGQLESGDLVQVVDFDVFPAELIGTSDLEIEGLYSVTYRFDRPPGGWPQFVSTVALARDFRPLRPERIGGFSPADYAPAVTFIRLNERAPVLAIMRSSTVDALSADTFQLEIDFASEHGIDLETVDDGDLQLVHRYGHSVTTQPGRLIQTVVKEEGRRVSAIYEFNRDPHAVFSGTWIKVHSPRGAVEDLAGNSAPGGVVEEFEFDGITVISQFGSVRQQQDIPQGEFDYGFIPLSPYHPDLLEYHFRVVYSSPVPIDLEDFVAHRHLVGETQPLGHDAQERLPDLHPELQNWRATDGGRMVEADYVVERPAWGWPRSVVIALIQQGIRDLENRVPPVPDDSPTLGVAIADLGGNEEDAIRATVLGGHEVAADAETHRIAILLEANERLEATEFADSLAWFGWHPEILPGFEEFDLPFPSAGRLVEFFGVDDEDVEDYDLRVFFDRPIEELPETGSGHYDLWITSDTIRFRAFARDGRVLIDRSEAIDATDRQFIYTESNLGGREKVRDVPEALRATLINIARLDGALKGGLAVATYEVERPAGGWESWDLGRVPFVLQVPAVRQQLTRIAGSEPFVGFVDVLSNALPLPLLQGFDGWLRDLEAQSGLPAERLVGDADGDGHIGIVEFAMGSDPTNGADVVNLSPETVSEDGQRFVTLTAPIRASAVGVTIELQSSTDGESWQSAGDEFEVVERARAGGGVDHLLLKARDPIDPAEHARIYRAIVVR